MSKYKIGNKLLIKKDLHVGREYGGLTWLTSMNAELSGKVIEVLSISPGGSKGVKAKIGGVWWITNKMIQRKVGRIEYILRRIFARRTIS